MSVRLRVASYNLRDLKDDVAAAVRVIRAIDPDVLCLQEVPRHPFSGHRVADLAAACGMYWSGAHRGSGGTTVLTSLRVDVRQGEHHGLKVARLARQRGYAVSHVSVPGHLTVVVASVHLSLDPQERAVHAAEVLAGLPGSGPLVVAGDLNEQSDGRAWSAIAGRLRPVTGDAPTFPARGPRRRLDAIFASSEMEVRIDGPPVQLEPADLLAATDHLPVWADLAVPALASG